MHYSLLSKALAVAAAAAPALALSAVLAAGPRSRTAPADDLDFPFPAINRVDDSDTTQRSSAKEDVADSAREDSPSIPHGLNRLMLIAPDATSDAVVAPRAQDQTVVFPEDDADTTEDEFQSPNATTLSPRMRELREKLRASLGYYHQKRLNTRDHNPWEVMHSIVAYGVSSQLNRNGPDGPQVNAISWLCWNGDCKGIRILDVVGNRVEARKGPQVQGHPGQFLAILAQGCVATSCPIKIGDKHFTLADLIESEKRGCQAGTELTFKLIGFSYYLDIDARWKNTAGEDWSISRLVHEEMSQPIVGAACGGTHRLMGLAYAVRKRETSGLPMTGEFRRAKKYLDDYHRYAITRLQNSDGSFSTEWFKGPGARPDLGRRIQTSGHILEWLSYSLPIEMLTKPRVVDSVEYLTNVLYDNRGNGWDVGPLGHALHSLAIYDSRVFKPLDNRNLADIVAESAPTTPSEPAELPEVAAPRPGRPAVRPAPQPPRISRADDRPQSARANTRGKVTRP